MRAILCRANTRVSLYVLVQRGIVPRWYKSAQFTLFQFGGCYQQWARCNLIRGVRTANKFRKKLLQDCKYWDMPFRMQRSSVRWQILRYAISHARRWCNLLPWLWVCLSLKVGFLVIWQIFINNVRENLHRSVAASGVGWIKFGFKSNAEKKIRAFLRFLYLE